jgi:hypothetical protein
MTDQSLKKIESVLKLFNVEVSRKREGREKDLEKRGKMLIGRTMRLSLK